MGNIRSRPHILVLQGPNLNMLGVREPEIYGESSLEQIHGLLAAKAKEKGWDISFFQSNHEGDLIDRIHAARGQYDALIVNAGAFSHYSIALYDALKAVNIPFIEVHLSNIYAREAFRRHSLLAPLARGGIFGLGAQGYLLALEAIAEIIKEKAVEDE